MFRYPIVAVVHNVIWAPKSTLNLVEPDPCLTVPNDCPDLNTSANSQLFDNNNAYLSSNFRN